MKQLRILFTVVLLAGASLNGAQATAIHKWVDARGVTHYSDQPPAATTIPTTQLDIDTSRDSADNSTGNSDHYYSIANQWQRMNQEGLQRRQLELQRAAISAAFEARYQPAPQQAETESKRYVAVYPKRWHRKRGYRSGHHGGGPRQPKKPSGFPTVVRQPG
jgi:hypothetical protein